MRNCEHLVDLKTEQYWKNEERIWAVLKSMTTREIALSPVGTIAQEAGVGRNTLYKHREAYRHIVECRRKEAERIQLISERRRLND